MPVWDADAIPLQSVKVLKPIEPQVDPASWVDPYTRCWPLKGTWVKSLRETQPDLGVARAAVEFHL
jgi:hypothetical protein